MDECLGEFLSLWPFCEVLTERLFKVQRGPYLTALAHRIEESDQHWIFRQGLTEVVKHLVAAQSSGKLYGCFLLSNNGSQHLVECVRQILNFRAVRVGAQKELFLTGWSRNSPCRKGDMKKSLEEIEACLASEGFPGIHRLMFFDDMNHVLSGQIADYVQVTPYMYYTPVDLVNHIVSPVFQQMRISPYVLQAVSKRAKTMEAQDIKDRELIKSSPPPTQWTEALDAITRFFEVSKGGTRKSKRYGKSVKSHKTGKRGKSLRKRTQQTCRSRLWSRY